MAIVIGSAMTLSTAAYTKTANLITGRNQFLGKGRIVVCARGSAIGMNLAVSIGGVPLIDDSAIPFIGTTGALSARDHVVVDQVIAGGTAEMYLRNTTVGALTTDYVVYFTPM
jgi:hypothetical protein